MLLCFGLCACKSSKETVDSNGFNAHAQVEPEQMSPRVDTRFAQAFFQAQLEKSKGNPQKAYNLFQECLKIDPQDAAIHFELGRLEMELFSNPDNAIIHAKAAVNADKTNPWYHRLLGDVYMALNKFDLAAKAYKEVVRLNPDDPEAPYYQANALLNAGKTQEAITIYDDLQKATGPYEELSIQKHQLYLHLGNKEKAGLELEKLAQAFPEEPRYWGMVAQFYQNEGRLDKAKWAIDQLATTAQGNGQAHFQLSEFYAATGQDQASFEEMKLAFASLDVSIDQKIAVLLRYYSLTDKDRKYLPPAYELLELAQRTHPQEAKVYSIYGDFLYRDHKSDEALIQYRKAAQLDPSRQLIWQQVLIVEGELQEFNLMVEDSQKALEMFPSIPIFYLFQGMARHELKNYSQAIESFSTGKDLVIDDNELLMRFYSYLAEAYHKVGNHQQSDKAFDQAIALDGNNVFVLNNYAYYLAVRKVNLDKAAQMAKKANELAPNQSSFEDTYAWVLFQQGNYADALVWIKKAIGHTQASGELREHFGDILFMTGDVAGAMEQWKLAQTIGGASQRIDQKLTQKKYIE